MCQQNIKKIISEKNSTTGIIKEADIDIRGEKLYAEIHTNVS